LGTTVKRLLDAFDEDLIEQRARATNEVDQAAPISDEAFKKAQDEMIDLATEPFSLPELRTYIENVRRLHDQIIDNANLDHVHLAGWAQAHQESAEHLIGTFRQFIEANKDEITALSIIYHQSWKSRPLTLTMIRDLYEAIGQPPYNLTHERLWQAYSASSPEKVKAVSATRMLTDIVSLVRFELGLSDDLKPFTDVVDYNFMKWTLAKNAGPVHFTDEQMAWLRMIRDHVATSMSITIDDLSLSPFDDFGGLGKFYALFGDGYEGLLNEISFALVA